MNTIIRNVLTLFLVSLTPLATEAATRVEALNCYSSVVWDDTLWTLFESDSAHIEACGVDRAVYGHSQVYPVNVWFLPHFLHRETHIQIAVRRLLSDIGTTSNYVFLGIEEVYCESIECEGNLFRCQYIASSGQGVFLIHITSMENRERCRYWTILKIKEGDLDEHDSMQALDEAVALRVSTVG